MSRLNLTLDADTHSWLERHAAREKIAVASFARRLLREAVEQREHLARRRKLAADYAAGRADAREILDDLERPQLEGLLDDA
ncbi:MAG: hypothetical protein H0T89_31855 [Deltaproteobacteria bacterium]|nr:hypothetical protein [Deltaproteobacteria bacterium]MDQ3295880.1 hypothetical protein [Myxococcota bacterium]